MAYNGSYFVASLPPSFDNWNSSVRLEYFDESLQGFASLDDQLKEDVFRSLASSSTLDELWEIYHNQTLSEPNVTATIGDFASFLGVVADRLASRTTVANDMTTEDMFNVTLPCDVTTQLENQTLLYILPVSIVLFSLAFLVQRTRLRSTCCWGRPGLLYPINFIDDYERRWAFAAAFCLMAFRVLQLFNQSYFWAPEVFSDPVWMQKYGFTKILVGLLNVLLLCVVFYPLIACISLRHHVVANVIGFLYTLPFLVFRILIVISCPLHAKNDTKSSENRAILELVLVVPLCLALLLLLICFVMDFIINIRAHIHNKPRHSTVDLENDPQPYKYLAALLGRQPQTKFQIPASCHLHHGRCMFLSLQDTQRAANIIACGVQVIFMILMVLNFRRHLKAFFRGKSPFAYKYDASPPSTVVNALRYSGYQIAFVLWGYVLMYSVLYILIMLFLYFFVLPLYHGWPFRPLIDQLEALWPTIVVSLVIYLAQFLIAKFVFLRERGAVLALNNRRLFHAFSFFLFFFNVLLGLFSCLKRILLSAVFGMLVISRLDMVLYMEGFERFDTGFKAYLGMLHVDIYHNHPVVKAFVEILLEIRERQEQERVHLEEKGYPLEDAKAKRRRVIRNKWRKFITLFHNPMLVLGRMELKIKKLEKERLENQIADAAIEGGATAAAVVVGGGVLGVMSAIDSAAEATHGLSEAVNIGFSSQLEAITSHL